MTTFSVSIAVTSTEGSTGTSAMEPFKVDIGLQSLPAPFPSPEELRTALCGGVRSGREIMVRLWLTEGCPYAFRECPWLYEELRGWLGSRLNLHPKQITLIGSARIGYSLASYPEYGKPFGHHSDLDLSVISAELFERVAETFETFERDFEEGEVVPSTPKEDKWWRDNVKFGRQNAPRGFLDAKKVPNRSRYAATQVINQTMWALVKRLKATPGAPRIEGASTRVYRDWKALVDQVSLNLCYCTKGLSSSDLE